MSDDEQSGRKREGLTGFETLLDSDEPQSPGVGSSSSVSVSGGRFLPGAVLGARYRIVGLLGRGGMGEVYRAEDLKLGETVALKFLPERLAEDGAALARFHAEVRTARGITHKNVVRVHDLGEIEGEPFLAMEYVDGEDLESLLRRIGRLPQDKAVELSRQICAGLAAAHERGVLHRDLKPANVMIDGLGRAKINDFGLAGLAEEFEAGDVAGTPKYMAPEQLADGTVSFASDIFSLGLVLYEMFTGKMPFAAGSRAELITSHRESDPGTLSDHVSGVDPIVERAVLSCLARDPKERPDSALDVATRLPGGDPIAAALAAGETPSPDMVARSRVRGALKPWLGAALLGLLALLLVGGAFLKDRVSTFNLLELPREPVLLEDRARTLIEGFGYDLSSLESWRGFRKDFAQFAHLREVLEPTAATEMLRSNRPAAFQFWFAAAPERDPSAGFVPRWQHFETLAPGALRLALTPDGRLVEFAAQPPPYLEPSASEALELDWAILFEEAGFAIELFEETAPVRLPEGFADERRAWLGTYPGRPDVDVRLEAASLRGRPNFFRSFLPWHDLGSKTDKTLSSSGAIATVTLIVVPIVLGLALVLDWRNLRTGRGDRRGATRLSAFLLIAWTLGSVLGGSHSGSAFSRISVYFTELGWNLLTAAMFWVVYVALEPSLRRRWPGGLVSWSRLLGCQFQDPLVGRDVLLGSVLGTFSGAAGALLPYWNRPTFGDSFWDLGLEGISGAAVVFLQSHIYVTLMNAFIFIFFFTVLLALVRRRLLATGLLVVPIMLVLMGIWGPAEPADIAATLVVSVVLAGCVGIFGILATISCFFFFFVMVALGGLSLDFSTWYSGLNLAIWVLTLGIGVYAYRTATAGEPIFGSES